jgi:hypothetical protein
MNSNALMEEATTIAIPPNHIAQAITIVIHPSNNLSLQSREGPIIHACTKPFLQLAKLFPGAHDPPSQSWPLP